MLFKDEKVKTLTTDFKDKLERVYNYDNDYSPQYDYDDEEIPEYYDVLKVGDGQTALNLKDIGDIITRAESK